MGKVTPFPGGPFVGQDGTPTPPARAYLKQIERNSVAINAITNLDGGTTYNADELRDKIIEILTALQG